MRVQAGNTAIFQHAREGWVSAVCKQEYSDVRRLLDGGMLDDAAVGKEAERVRV